MSDRIDVVKYGDEEWYYTVYIDGEVYTGGYGSIDWPDVLEAAGYKLDIHRHVTTEEALDALHTDYDTFYEFEASDFRIYDGKETGNE